MSIGKMGRLATVPLEGRTDWPDDRLARQLGHPAPPRRRCAANGLSTAICYRAGRPGYTHSSITPSPLTLRSFLKIFSTIKLENTYNGERFAITCTMRFF